MKAQINIPATYVTLNLSDGGELVKIINTGAQAAVPQVGHLVTVKLNNDDYYQGFVKQLNWNYGIHGMENHVDVYVDTQAGNEAPDEN